MRPKIEQQSENKGELKFPPFIEVEGDRAEIHTDAGNFHLPKEMLDLYIDEFSVNQENFQYQLPYYIGEGKRDKNPVTIETRNKVRQFLESQGFNPKDFLDEYGSNANEERIMELWGVLPQEILEEIMFNALLWHFSPKSENPFNTHFECRIIGGSSREFFGQPFMGGYGRLGSEQEMRENRKRLLGIKSQDQNLILFTNRKKWIYSGLTYFEKNEADDEELGQQVRQKLEEIYKEKAVKPVQFDKIDYARVVMKPTDYDENMEAFPEPIRLEFIRNEKVIAVVDDPKEIEIFKPRQEDCKLADVIRKQDGSKYYVEIDTEGFDHTLRFTDEKMDWYNRYLTRISAD